MENIIISTEATCDLTKDMIDKYNLKVINMEYIIDDTIYNTANDSVVSSELYSKMKKGAKTSTTQINQCIYEEFFESNLNDDTKIIHIAFSRGLSETYISATNGAKAVNDKYGQEVVFVIDSICACSGQGFASILISEFAKKAVSVQEVVNYANKICAKMEHIFTVDKLKYLANGGRVKPATALIGNLLNIKPVMKMDENGKLVVTNKVMSRKKAITALYEKMQNRVTHKDKCFVSHADCLDDAKTLAELIKTNLNIQVIITDLGPIIGSHSGPGTLAVFYVGQGKAN